MPTVLETFSESLERCLAVPGFVSTFYVRLLGSSEEIKEKFSYTNFDEQQHRLAGSLRVLPHVMTGEQDALRHLTAVAESHSRVNRNIRPELYSLWQDILMMTVEETDPNCSEEVMAAWQAITDDAVQFMVHRY